MISLPKLDDQNYAEIVEAAKRRIPVIFPEWTDFNEHDPGITVIELFAWLKEMQQYTLDRIPDSTREAMLRLAGVQPLEAAPAAVELIPAAPPGISACGEHGTFSRRHRVHTDRAIPPPGRADIENLHEISGRLR